MRHCSSVVMTLKQVGVELVAEGASKYFSTLADGNKAVTELGESADKAASRFSGFGKIVGGLAIGGAVAGIGALSAALVTGIGDAREAATINAQTEAIS
jgi:hypothetical protein